MPLTSSIKFFPSTLSPALLRLVILAYAFNMFSLITADTDIWGHVKFGEEIRSNQALPEVNTYSYTAPEHRWINHEWLTEVLFSLIYSHLGSTGLLIFKLIIGLWIVHILSSIYFAKEKNQLVYFFYFILLIPILAPGFMTRPQLMTFLFFTVLMFLFQRFFDGNNKILVWTPLLMLVWVNCHGGVVAGIGIYFLVAVVEGIRCFLSGEKHGKVLIGFFALSCMALLINPYGYKLWVFFYHSLGQTRAITEWGPVTLWNTSFWEFKIVVVFFLATLVLPGKKRIWEVLIILLAVIYGIKYQRHTVLTAIVMTPYLPLRLAELANRVDMHLVHKLKSPEFFRIIIFCLGIFATFQLYFGFQTYRPNNFKILVDPQVYPSYAVQFMRRNEIFGNTLVPFDWGEYLIFNLPQSKVSVDGRFRTAYPEKVLNQNLDFQSGRQGWQTLLVDYPTEIILTRKSRQTHRLLEQEDSWLKIYEDPISMIFVRKNLPPGSVEKKFYNEELLNPQDPPSSSFP